MPVFDTTMIVVTIIFVLTYSLMLVFAQKRVFFALGGAIVLLVLGLTGFIPNMSLQYLFLEGINWNVLMMLFGTMGLVSLFIDTGMPALIADKILDRSPNYRFAIISLALFAGVVSAFIDNVATV
ncbi:MAG: SLC13 family permease, partial [Bacilli bacterium]